MFDKIKRKIRELVAVEIKEHIRIYHSWVAEEYHHCEICGCLLVPGSKRGKGMIKTNKTSDLWEVHEQDYIYYPYYCKIHDPEAKNEE